MKNFEDRKWEGDGGEGGGREGHREISKDNQPSKEDEELVYYKERERGGGKRLSI